MKKINQNGFSMVEILFTIFIMAIALFGLSALQLTTVKNVTNSQVKTFAIFYLEDMAERMRSNKTGRDNGEYKLITGKETASDNVANTDAYLWNQLISNASSNSSLPEGAIGTVEYDEVTQLYDIAITWKEQQNQNTNPGGVEIEKSFTLSVQL